jgi:hypothetical protein
MIRQRSSSNAANWGGAAGKSRFDATQDLYEQADGAREREEP